MPGGLKRGDPRYVTLVYGLEGDPEFGRGRRIRVELRGHGPEATSPPGGLDTLQKATVYHGEVRAPDDPCDLGGAHRLVEIAKRVAWHANHSAVGLERGRGGAPILSHQEVTTRPWTEEDLERVFTDPSRPDGTGAGGWYPRVIREAYERGDEDGAEDWRRHWVASWSGGGGWDGSHQVTSRGMYLGLPDGHIVEVPWKAIMERCRSGAVREVQGTLF